MSCRVVDSTGASLADLDRATLEERRANGFFWLDLHDPTAEDLELLGDVLGFHALALEDSAHFDQRPKLEEYDDFVFLVLYGHAPDEDGLVEVHCYVSEQFLVTLRRDDSPALAALHRSYAGGRDVHPDPVRMLHRVADALVDSFFPALSHFDDRLELIEDDLIRSPKPAHLQDVFTMKRRLARLRKVIVPQRDLLGRLASGAAELPQSSPEVERHFRDVYDHLIRLAEMIETSREVMTAAVDVYLSSSSNRLGEVTKQLAVIATIFLPLTFITGFFGQNFPWLVEHIGGLWSFVALGIGTQLVGALILLVYFKRRGWF